jgi:hypothetical protein
MCSACNESLIGRLEEGDVDERGGEEVEDNCKVHKETAPATRRFYKHEGKLSFLILGNTKFGSNFIMVDQLLQVRTVLEQSVVDP